MKLGPWFSVIACIWCVAILSKVITVRLRGERYKFTSWDGGLMLRGTELGAGGTYAFGMFVAALGGVSLWVLHAWSKV
jgi:hypothetical protein